MNQVAPTPNPTTKQQPTTTGCHVRLQKEVLTPGQNQKGYLAGALDPETGELTIVEGSKKNSDLFLRMLESLITRYADAKRIYVILDNYRIHSSRIVQAALSHRLKKISLVFLPPYCPNENKIERVWKDLHDEVTRNHPHATMDDLMKAVHRYLRCRNRRSGPHRTRMAA